MHNERGGSVPPLFSAGKKLAGKQNGKFRSSLFKGLQAEGSALVALRRARNTQAYNPSCRG